MSNQQSVSAFWREKGNDFYRQVTDGLSPAVQETRLREAINHYGRAVSSASDDADRSSATKNMAMANWKMAKAQEAHGTKSTNISFYYKEAFKHFQDAKDYGQKRDPSWHASLGDAALRCWYDLRQRLDEWEDENRIREVEKLIPFIIDDATKAHEYLEIANHYFNWSVTALGERDYRQCLTLLKDCHFPLKEAQRFGKDDGHQREYALLEEDIYTQQCVAESVQERIKGEQLLDYVIRDEEILNIDMIWEIVDTFRRAAQLTRERDLEMEAMALSVLGKVYDKVLKLKDRAKACLMKALELANSMVPRNFTGDEWYEFARSTVERYQQEKLKEEEDRHQKEREANLNLVKEEVEILEKKFQELSKAEFLKFIYATHPPKKEEHKLGEISATPEWRDLKKLYQKAVVHYHPDKADVEQHGKKWKVLTEEITKLLTRHYEFYKGCEPNPAE